MASSFPNGTIFAISTAFGTAKTVTSITNASPGVATATAHAFEDGNILLLSMPSQLDLRAVRVDNAATNAFDLEGVNTTSTTTYPSGFGAGTAKDVTTWSSLSQITDVQSSGGEQQFYQWTYLEDGRQRQRPTFKNARALTLTLDYDADLSWHAALLAADLARDPVVLRASLPNGSYLYYSVYVGFDGEPTFTINENQQTSVSFAYASPFSTRYAS